MNTVRNLLIVTFLGASAASPAYAHPSLPMDNSIADVAERVVESVVNIDIEAEVPVDPFFVDMFGADEVQLEGASVIAEDGLGLEQGRFGDLEIVQVW